ncbi:hypothetical protein SPBR_05011 [Sporothrix brasiliensis 5110]|uniref:HNH nuclease domain-containing protein n=1 Tax=Sporothrix brasiliensis 5110 TaxID=1398154 RepID=A0A0C2IR16_9PEZI|nr:uncharacterized protein SPBR_05011 [Sporothrix brasiliensis 5110]KIH87477.1 hypothetical protein SPBR_05011 [Sporothrix brasiliensis 5110]
MTSPVPHHRHQASLEDVIDLSPQPPLGPSQRARARRIFYRIAERFEAAEPPIDPRARPPTYSQPLLVRLTFEYARSEESRDIFLRAFFKAMALDLDAAEGGDDPDPELDFGELRPLFVGFADYLMDNFFLPLKASTRRTPQPSPAYHSAVLRAQGVETPAFVGTPERLSSLRGACLVRDRHRCVISRKFSDREFIARLRQYGDDARDDDGILFSEQDPSLFDGLEVAHILPHALMKSNTNFELNQSREAALAILNMFDSGVAHVINGVDIDRPRNALTLSMRFHQLFGSFDVFFTPVTDTQHTYRIETFHPVPIALGLPVTRALFITDTRTIDPPSPRLLAVHRAIAHILHLSGAGFYIDMLLRDMEDNVVRSDGTSALGQMVTLGLGGWLDGAVSS